MPHLFSKMFIEMLVYGNVTKTVSRHLQTSRLSNAILIKTPLPSVIDIIADCVVK